MCAGGDAGGEGGHRGEHEAGQHAGHQVARHGAGGVHLKRRTGTSFLQPEQLEGISIKILSGFCRPGGKQLGQGDVSWLPFGSSLLCFHLQQTVEDCVCSLHSPKVQCPARVLRCGRRTAGSCVQSPANAAAHGAFRRGPQQPETPIVQCRRCSSCSRQRVRQWATEWWWSVSREYNLFND